MKFYFLDSHFHLRGNKVYVFLFKKEFHSEFSCLIKREIYVGMNTQTFNYLIQQSAVQEMIDKKSDVQRPPTGYLTHDYQWKT